MRFRLFFCRVFFFFSKSALSLSLSLSLSRCARALSDRLRRVLSARNRMEEDDLDDLDDEFRVDSDDDDDDREMGFAEEEYDDDTEETEREKNEEKKDEEKAEEEGKEKVNQMDAEVTRRQRAATQTSIRDEPMKPRQLQITLDKVAQSEGYTATAANTNATKRNVLPPTPANTPAEMVVEDVATKEQTNFLLKQRSMLPSTMTSPSKKKHRCDDGTENAITTKTTRVQDLPTTTATTSRTNVKEQNTDKTSNPSLPVAAPVETNINTDSMKDEELNAVDAIDLTSRLERLLDEAKELNNRSTSAALNLTVTSCEYHFVVNPASMEQIKRYKKQAEEILAQEELRKTRASAMAPK